MAPDTGPNPTFVLVIGGYDPTGGAGILADLEVLREFGFPARAVLTAVTAQNGASYRGHQPVPAVLVKQQMEAVSRGLRVVAVKVGMIPDVERVWAVANALDTLQRESPDSKIPIIVDPVMESSTGGRMLAEEALEAYRNQILARATIETPNLAEAERLHGARPVNADAMREQASRMARKAGHAVLLKGGHLAGTPVDALAAGGETWIFSGQRLPEARGTGCRLATALAVHLARDRSLPQAVRLARAYVQRYLFEANQQSK